MDDNLKHAERHARHALEDFEALVGNNEAPATSKIAHALSHHLRHVVYRLGRELKDSA